jgi:branched-chain amino acid transport system permease protein
MSAEMIAQSLVSGILMGFVYALVAAGLSLIFGLMEIVNFAHGEFLMLGMFAAFWFYTLLGMDPLISVPVCAALLFALGVATHYGLVRRILDAPMLIQICATFGLAVFLRSLAQFLWTPDFRTIADPWAKGRLEVAGLFLGRPQVVASLGCLAAFGLLYLFITRTETGLALQATAQDKQAAQLMGIRTDRMFALGWGIGAACVGVAAALLTQFFYVFPEVGGLFALLAYVAVALGGFGSITGALYAGILIGIVEGVGGLMAPSFKFAVVFALFLVAVLWRPQGLFGRTA